MKVLCISAKIYVHILNFTCFCAFLHCFSRYCRCLGKEESRSIRSGKGDPHKKHNELVGNMTYDKNFHSRLPPVERFSTAIIKQGLRRVFRALRNSETNDEPAGWTTTNLGQLLLRSSHHPLFCGIACRMFGSFSIKSVGY